MKILRMLYALFTYLMMGLVLLGFLFFFENVFLDKTVSLPLVESFSWQSLFLDIGLIGLFGIQHSIMARDWFKRFITFLVPASVERVTYILLTNIVIGLLIWQWKPFGNVLWDVRGHELGYILYTLSFMGLIITGISVVLISTREFIGLEQLNHGKGNFKKVFVQPLFYKYVRHPIYFGLILALWTVPLLTWSSLLFNIGMTIYIIIGALLEERNLVLAFGNDYKKYQKEVPMLIPFLKIFK